MATALALLALLAFVACQAAGAPAGSLVASLDGIPAPTDAVLDTGGNRAAVDGDHQFVAYRSTADPKTTLSRFSAQLGGAGYRQIGKVMGWLCFVRGNGQAKGGIALVYVEREGPPTTLLVAAGTEADMTVALGTTALGPPPARGVGTPDPASGVGNGNRSGGRGGSGGVRSTAKPSPKPKATAKPKPTPKPKATPRPDPSQRNEDAGRP